MSRLSKTISVEKLDNSVLFTFAQNQHYLYDGTIEVPFNSLSIIADKSEAITLRKSASNDIFISAPWENFDIIASSKEDVVDALVEMLYDETGGGVSREEVEDMIDAATSGIPSSQVIEQLRTDVNTVSGDVENKQDVLSAGTGIEISGNVISATGASITVDSELDETSNNPVANSAITNVIIDDEEVISRAINELNDRLVAVESGGSSVTVDTSLDSGSTNPVANSAITSAINAKQDALSAGTGIEISGNVISVTGGGGATYSAGTNISIDTANTINCTLPLRAAGSNNTSIKQSTNSSIGSSASLGAAFGLYNSIENNTYGAFVSGYNVRATKNYEAGFGHFNNSVTGSTASGQTLFSVGNGQYHAEHNAFEIRENGDIYITSGNTDIKLQDHLGGGSSVTVDTSLDSGSTNPVANSAITVALDGKANTSDLTIITNNVETISGAVDGKQDVLSAGTGIEISGNVISATGGGVLVINSEDLMNNMTDEKWDELANALENDIPIFSVIDASDEGITDIQQFPVNGMIIIDENEGTTEITLNQLFGGGYYDIHIQKNGSEDYSVTGGGGGSYVYYTEDTSSESATIKVQNDDGLGNRSENRVFVNGGDIIIESYNETDDGEGNTGTTDTQVDINSLGLSIITYSDDGIDTTQTELKVQPMGAYINSEPIATEPYVDAALSGKADTSAVTAAIDAAKAYYISFATLATQGITDNDWNGIVAAIDDHRPIYAGYPRQDGGIIYYGVECMNKNVSNTEIVMTASDNSAHYFYTFTKNGSNDYSYTVDTKPYVPDITTAITSGSTDSEIPTAKATYDAIQAGGGGGVTVDQNLNRNSTNAISNKAVVEGLDNTTDMLLNKLSGEYTTTAEMMETYWTSAQTQSAITQAVSGKADASNVYNKTEVYTKTEVNNLVNNKFWCGTQAQYDALAVKENDVLYLIHE